MFEDLKKSSTSNSRSPFTSFIDAGPRVNTQQLNNPSHQQRIEQQPEGRSNGAVLFSLKWLVLSPLISIIPGWF